MITAQKSAKKLAADGEHRAFGMGDDVIAAGLRQVRDSGKVLAAADAENDHVRSVSLGNFKDLFRRTAALDHAIGLAAQFRAKGNDVEKRMTKGVHVLGILPAIHQDEVRAMLARQRYGIRSAGQRLRLEIGSVKNAAEFAHLAGLGRRGRTYRQHGARSLPKNLLGHRAENDFFQSERRMSADDHKV